MGHGDTERHSEFVVWFMNTTLLSHSSTKSWVHNFTLIQLYSISTKRLLPLTFLRVQPTKLCSLLENWNRNEIVSFTWSIYVVDDHAYSCDVKSSCRNFITICLILQLVLNCQRPARCDVICMQWRRPTRPVIKRLPQRFKRRCVYTANGAM